MKVFEVRYVGYHTPCLVVAETASQAANIAVSYRSSAWGLKDYHSPPTIESWKMLGEVIGRPWEKSRLTIDEAAKRAAEKIELRFGRPDRPVDELAVEQIIAAEFASLQAENDRLRKGCIELSRALDQIDELNIPPAVAKEMAKDPNGLISEYGVTYDEEGVVRRTTENVNRLRGLLERARKYARGVDLCSDIDAEFAEFAPIPDPVSDAEINELFRIAPVQATYEQISKMQAGLFRLTGELDRLRGLLTRARIGYRDEMEIARDIDAALKGATE